ncbi:hypothetical protein EXN66_Car006249 [Channa argus]|uniref:Phorbol-ester/DAG-type domain-containing protein n=1 Tax=Channa argus TaxID=215402 RepID=A0A6G1PKP2_CHAAH|nr:hypothetical protein EXN66_Car006249 [Channa argus]
MFELAFIHLQCSLVFGCHCSECHRVLHTTCLRVVGSSELHLYFTCGANGELKDSSEEAAESDSNSLWVFHYVPANRECACCWNKLNRGVMVQEGGSPDTVSTISSSPCTLRAPRAHLSCWSSASCALAESKLHLCGITNDLPGRFDPVRPRSIVSTATHSVGVGHTVPTTPLRTLSAGNTAATVLEQRGARSEEVGCGLLLALIVRLFASQEKSFSNAVPWRRSVNPNSTVLSGDFAKTDCDQ